MASGKEFHRPCANCQGKADLSCKTCKLVLYCSANCRKTHWSKHRADCKSPLMRSDWKPSWELEKRTPAFIGNGPPMVAFGGKKYFWGNVPAYDVLKLAANEGEHYEKELRLLFAASGDPRNVVKTLASVPAGYDSSLTFVINDLNFDIVARNIIFVLTALVVEDDKDAIECMIHLWYSSLLRPSDAALLNAKIRPMIQDVVNEIASKPDNNWQGKSWTIGTNTCRVELPKRSWDQLLAYFDVPAGLTAERANQVRKEVTMAAERVDYRDRHMLQQMPAHRLGITKFREDGILLPFGASRVGFTVPNPTFFQSATWPMKDSSDPLGGWNYSDILSVDSGPASNDVYGKLFYHLQDLLAAFRLCLSNQGCKFHMLNANAAELPKHLAGKYFARIETSNIADKAYLGTAGTVHSLGPLLQEHDENPCATLITHYMNAVEEICQEDYASYGDVSKVFQYIQMPTSMPSLDASSTWAITTVSAARCVRDGDKHFDRYMSAERFQQVAAASRMSIKDLNTIMEKWPLQLKKKPGQPGAREEFDLLRSSGHGGSQRYVEWKRASDDMQASSSARAFNNCALQ